MFINRAFLISRRLLRFPPFQAFHLTPGTQMTTAPMRRTSYMRGSLPNTWVASAWP